MLSERDIFGSVFPLTSLSHTTPTPLSTPLIGSSTSFGAITSPTKQSQQGSAAQLQVKRSVAWSVATRYLSLDNVTTDDWNTTPKRRLPRKRKTREVEEALEFLLAGDGVDGELDEEWDLAGWYNLEVRTHFLNHVAPPIVAAWSKPISTEEISDHLKETIHRLLSLQSLYTTRLDEDILPAIKHGKHPKSNTTPDQEGSGMIDQQRRVQSMFQTTLHALYLRSFPTQRLSNALSFIMHDLLSKIFGLEMTDHNRIEPPIPHPQPVKELMALLRRLQEVGLGSEFGQRAFSGAMWKLLNDFITGQSMMVDWDNRGSRTKVLTRWIIHGFVPLARSAVAALGGTDDEVCQFQKMAVARLGTGRIDNLFDYIVKWDSSLGAIRDIKEYITTPEARLLVTNTFSEQITRRLLHAGATTTHILNIYINIIRAFNELDSKGVLLDRVARPVRRYLRQREDTARIIVTSLLADVEDSAAEVGTDISIEITKEMSRPIAGIDGDEDGDMDWDNLEWAPDPIDVAPDFKRSKNQDVTSALLSLYDREDFISELKTILGEHLLRNYDISEHFEKEERLLELFKNRLGEDKLQACEVMLRDVQFSRALNTAIHRFQPYVTLSEKFGSIKLHAHILSSFFWPSLKDDQFRVPAPIQALQKDYEEGFEAIKDMRKLKWLTALGRVTVELELEDRRFEEAVPTWTASVIYAFQSEDGVSPSKTIAQLCEELEMEETLVRNAIFFWRSNHILREISTDTFSVIEKLSSETEAELKENADPLPLEDDAGVSAVKSQQDLLNENADLYRQFITGMLTNQGNLPLMRIFMMLKMVVPGGFNFGMDEVKALLQGMVEEGKLVGQGDIYGISKD